ncbi:MMS19 nucleotide excision repair protein homolog [Rhododendron vialii]|uniref:MMS19 nucleotide excision repair protein homolog n=1 Tax=Rhododendron vialii TaxID=182163 RepID=UPI00265E5D7C|nr:MMS19 nucleotide excision repair protein homolog [Rhododendron vialii]
MADSIHWIKHVESYVDSSGSPSQQVASLDAIAALLKNDMLKIEELVRDMEMYLTTTDSIIRSRGILLLAELLQRLASKPLNDAVIHSLIGFFTERLADWKALRGALVGCLALMKRKSNVGMVTINEARAVAQSYLVNLQVQSLGQHDRKLCYELLECLFDRYPDVVAALDDNIVHGICEAIDGEKDPQCLMITFRIVELLARIFPDPSGPLASFAEELFEILGSYFPIHFTHPKGDEVEVKRDELSRALMLAFASTPLFEPFAVPLLLEKLSSTLPSTKVESLRYLSYCSVLYGAERMAQHAETLWASLKDALFNSLESISSLELEPVDDMGFQGNQIATEALLLLQKVVQQNEGSFLSLIVGDEEINLTINSITTFKNYGDIPMPNKKKLHAVGRILSVSARASIASCNRVFEIFFLRLMDTLRLSGSCGDIQLEDGYKFSGRLDYGALYLCIELLTACRCLVLGSEGRTSTTVSAHETWSCMLQSFCRSLTEAFSFTLVITAHEESQNAYVHSGVRGLQIMATFPGSFLPVPKLIFESILTRLMSIITLNFDNGLLWKLSLKALVEIASFVDTRHDSDKATCFKGLVVERIVLLLSSNDSTMPLSLKLKAISEIGPTGLNFMLSIVQGLEKAVFDRLSDALVHGNIESAESAVQLLECLSNKLLPWFDKIGGYEEFPFHFAVDIWDHIAKNTDFNIGLQENELLDATMTAVKLAVAKCSEESQSIIIQKALNVLFSSATFPSEESISGVNPSKLEASQHNHGLNSFPCRDKWIVSLFASVIIAVRPQTRIPNVKVIVHIFLTTLLSGHVPAAQALGSMVNKLPLKSNVMETSDVCSLEAALDIIFSSIVWTPNDSGLRRFCGTSDGSEIGSSGLRLSNLNSSLLQVHAIVGLAWMGKGLLMRGHEKVKDITMTIFSCLLSNSDSAALSLKQHPIKDSDEEDVLPLMKSAADAFHVLMSDSEACLNRRFHAVIRPLYKQRFFSTMMPVLISSVVKSNSSITRSMLYRAFAHIISNTPHSAILSEAKKLIPLLVDSLSILSEDISNSEVIYSVLLVLSAILTDNTGQEAVVENAYIIITRLLGLISYPHMMLVRETAIQCLVAMSALPHSRIYPMRSQVLRAISNALDDPKRAVRQEAVRCRQAWATIASRSLQY